MTRVVLFGPPGAGKGTQAALLSDALGVPAISTGDLFREHLRLRSAIGLALESTIAAGEYVSDEVTTTMVEQRLHAADAATGFLLDGYPRTAPQVRDLDRILNVGGVVLEAVVVLDAPDEVLTNRLLHRAQQLGRTDDTQAVITHRLELYRRETAPLIARYNGRGLVHRIDADRDRTSVQDDLLAALRPWAVSGGLPLKVESSG